MRGVVVISNEGPGNAVIQRSDGLIYVAELRPGMALNFSDIVELDDVEKAGRVWIQNLTVCERIEVLVRRLDVELEQDEKIVC